MSNGLDNFLNAAGKLVDIVPTAYEDALQPAVRELGKTIAKIPQAINAALIDVDCWVAEKNYKLDETKKLLEIKLENVDPSKIVPPEPYVAIPALQAISYCMDSEELKNMFANVLASAMNSDTKNDVHPSYVEIIKQLSPFDCNHLTVFSKSKRLPIAKYNIEKKQQTISTIRNHVFLSNPTSLDITANAICISNLMRLGLIDVTYETSLAYQPQYTMFEEEPFFKTCRSMMPNNGLSEEENEFYTKYHSLFSKDDHAHFVNAAKAIVIKGVCELTPIGRTFCSTCID